MTGALEGWDVRSRLSEIQRPDPGRARRATTCPLHSVSKTLVDGISGAQEVVLEDSSHMPVIEETERYLSAVPREFLYAVEAR